MTTILKERSSALGSSLRVPVDKTQAEEFNELLTRLQPHSQQSLENLNKNVLAGIQHSLDDAFGTLKLEISRRKLFVLYEDILCCDPATDHDIPKNVLPLFLEFINSCQQKLRVSCYGIMDTKLKSALLDVLWRECGQRFNQKNDQNAVLVAHLTRVVKLYEKLLEQCHGTIGELQRRCSLEDGLIREQIHQVRQLQLLYNNDKLNESLGDIKADNLSQADMAQQKQMLKTGQTETLIQRMNEFKLKVDELEKDKKGLQLDVEGLRAKVVTLNAQHLEEIQTQNALEVQIQQLKSELQELQSLQGKQPIQDEQTASIMLKMNPVQRQLVENIQTASDELKDQLTIKQQLLDERKTIWDAKQKEYEQQIQQLKATLTKYDHEYQNSTTTTMGLQQQMKDLVKRPDVTKATQTDAQKETFADIQKSMSRAFLMRNTNGSAANLLARQASQTSMNQQSASKRESSVSESLKDQNLVDSVVQADSDSSSAEGFVQEIEAKESNEPAAAPNAVADEKSPVQQRPMRLVDMLKKPSASKKPLAVAPLDDAGKILSRQASTKQFEPKRSEGQAEAPKSRVLKERPSSSSRNSMSEQRVETRDAWMQYYSDQEGQEMDQPQSKLAGSGSQQLAPLGLPPKSPIGLARVASGRMSEQPPEAVKGLPRPLSRQNSLLIAQQVVAQRKVLQDEVAPVRRENPENRPGSALVGGTQKPLSREFSFERAESSENEISFVTEEQAAHDVAAHFEELLKEDSDLMLNESYQLSNEVTPKRHFQSPLLTAKSKEAPPSYNGPQNTVDEDANGKNGQKELQQELQRSKKTVQKLLVLCRVREMDVTEFISQLSKVFPIDQREIELLAERQRRLEAVAVKDIQEQINTDRIQLVAQRIHEVQPFKKETQKLAQGIQNKIAEDILEYTENIVKLQQLEYVAQELGETTKDEAVQVNIKMLRFSQSARQRQRSCGLEIQARETSEEDAIQNTPLSFVSSQKDKLLTTSPSSSLARQYLEQRQGTQDVFSRLYKDARYIAERNQTLRDKYFREQQGRYQSTQTFLDPLSTFRVSFAEGDALQHIKQVCIQFFETNNQKVPAIIESSLVNGQNMHKPESAKLYRHSLGLYSSKIGEKQQRPRSGFIRISKRLDESYLDLM